MRDIVLFGALALAAPAILIHPYIGALLWVLFGLMNPHRLTWGAAYDFPFAMVIAILTFVGIALTRDERKIKGGVTAAVLLVFMLWMCVTTISPINPDQAVAMWVRVMKVIGMTFVLIFLLHTKRHVELLVWTIVASLAFYGVKGGIFMLATGGNHMVFGPEGSVMAGNNALGTGLAMTVPLMAHLYTQSENRWVRRGLVVSTLLCAASALGTYSRGALLAVAAMGVLLWLRGKHKMLTATLIVIVGLLIVPFMPEHWEERMGTIATYEQDSSAMGRIISWGVALNLALDRPHGGGFEYWGPETSARYSSVPDLVAVAHSIYFQVLGEHGFLGLGLFLLFWVLVWRDCAWIRKRTRNLPDLHWALSLASMTQASLVGYAVGGAFLNIAFWDMPYYLFAAIAVTKHVVKHALEPVKPNVPASAMPVGGVADAGSTARAAQSRGASRTGQSTPGLTRRSS